MLCPYCKASIEDHSFYCDQCGQEILICPKCGKPGKGRFCISDGTPLVPAKKILTSQSPFIASTPLSMPNSLSNELHLINKNLGIDIKIEKDVLIGRTGELVNIFGKFLTVSRKHLKILRDPQRGWVAIDLGSTNGTKYNGTPLIPYQPQRLTNKSFLQIANIEFFIIIKDKNQLEKKEEL